MNRTKIIVYTIIGVAALIIFLCLGGKSVEVARMMAKFREKIFNEKIKIKEKELDKIIKKDGHVAGKIEDKQKELDTIVKNQNELIERAKRAETADEIIKIFRSIK